MSQSEILDTLFEAEVLLEAARQMLDPESEELQLATRKLLEIRQMILKSYMPKMEHQ